MMDTTKLFYQDAYIRRFDAQVLACDKDEDGFHIQLDQTAFFPEGGGQTADTGILDSVRVLDVQEQDGCIIHLTDGPLQVGATVTGQIDWKDRFRKMQDHTGEHIVSGLIHARYGFDNVGFHLADDGCTIDLNGELDRAALDEIEMAANEIVWEDRPVTTSFPAPEELKDMSYRSKLELHENVRIVTIEGVDRCACCAPHVAHTGQIGVIKLLDFMRHRGGVRIWVKCGMDALNDYRARYTASAAISSLLNTPQDKITGSVERLLDQRDDLKHELSAMQKQILEAQAAAIAPTDGDLLLFTQADDAGMRILANSGVERCGGACAVFSGTDGDFHFVMASRSLDMRSYLKALPDPLAIRGGGSAQMVSGRSTATKADIEAFFEGR